MFQRDHMVTAFDVKYGKPHPEPYLMGLEKAGVQANEAIVVEKCTHRSPSRSSGRHIHCGCQYRSAGQASLLLDAGSRFICFTMQALCDDWERLQTALDASNSLRHKIDGDQTI